MPIKLCRNRNATEKSQFSATVARHYPEDWPTHNLEAAPRSQPDEGPITLLIPCVVQPGMLDDPSFSVAQRIGITPSRSGQKMDDSSKTRRIALALGIIRYTAK